jgi:major membrane immunogen (membrane-anchored lipoprotein)
MKTIKECCLVILILLLIGCGKNEKADTKGLEGNNVENTETILNKENEKLNTDENMDELYNAWVESVRAGNIEQAVMDFQKLDGSYLNDANEVIRENIEIVAQGLISLMDNSHIKTARGFIDCLDDDIVNSQEFQQPFFVKSIICLNDGEYYDYKIFSKYVNGDMLDKLYNACYNMANEKFDNQDYTELESLYNLLPKDKYPDKFKRMDAVRLICLLENNDKIPVSVLNGIADDEVAELMPQQCLEIIKTMQDSLKTFEGYYKGGRPYYICIKNNTICFGDEKGASRDVGEYEKSTGKWSVYGETLIEKRDVTIQNPS